MTLSRFSSLSRLRQRAVPSPWRRAVLKEADQARGLWGAGFGETSSDSGAPWAFHKRQAVQSPITDIREIAMHHHGRLGLLGKVTQVPGMFAFFEDAVLNHRAPIIIIKDHKRVGYWHIGEIERSAYRWSVDV